MLDLMNRAFASICTNRSQASRLRRMPKLSPLRWTLCRKASGCRWHTRTKRKAHAHPSKFPSKFFKCWIQCCYAHEIYQCEHMPALMAPGRPSLLREIMIQHLKRCCIIQVKYIHLCNLNSMLYYVLHFFDDLQHLNVRVQVGFNLQHLLAKGDALELLRCSRCQILTVWLLIL